MVKAAMAIIGVPALATLAAVLAACGGSTAEPPTPGPSSTPTPAIPIATTSDGALDEAGVRALLTVDEVRSKLAQDVTIEPRIQDTRAMAEAVDPFQVIAMDSWYTLPFLTEDGSAGVILDVIDFDFPVSARDHWARILIEQTTEVGFQSIEPGIGEGAIGAEFNSNGIGSIVVFVYDQWVVSLRTVMPEGEDPIVEFDDIKALARMVRERL